MIRLLDFRGFDPSDPNDGGVLDEVVEHLRGGGVIAYPTETVYGFGSTVEAGAVQRLRELKRRPDAKPVLALVGGVEAVADLEWTPEARELAEIFWPGALTLILRDGSARFPMGVRSEESGGVAVRHTSHPIAGALVDALGAPLTSSSANAPGSPPARSGTEAAEALEELSPEHEVLILDAGPLPPSESSTLVDCTGPAPVVLREGSIPLDRLRCALPNLQSSDRA